jgi:hypothetical protein
LNVLHCGKSGAHDFWFTIIRLEVLEILYLLEPQRFSPFEFGKKKKTILGSPPLNYFPCYSLSLSLS